MYSVVLMAALVSGGSAPDWHCHGRAACYGCWGACWGSGYGGCYGGWGGWSMGYGCWGGYSSCFGGGCFGGGCFGGGWGCMGDGCWGGYGCADCYGGAAYAPTYLPGATVAPGATMPPASPGGEQLPAPKPDETKGSMTSNRARLIVELPAGAKLYIDDNPIPVTAGRRAFQTPALDRTQTYYYEVRAEVMRDGKPVRETKRVIVRAGEVVRANFRDLGNESVAAAKAR
jgi:uncharacterized protein (TIGR03000 family)